MFAHQVIEDLLWRAKQYQYGDEDKEYRRWVSSVIPKIEGSQKFSMGDVETIPVAPCVWRSHAFNSGNDEIEIYSLHEDLSNTQLPYNCCWIDMIESNSVYITETNIPDYTRKMAARVGLLAEKTGDDIIHCSFFQFQQNRKIWQLYPISCSLTINYNFKECGQMIFIIAHEQTKRTLAEMQNLVQNITHNVRRLFVFLRLVSCKNIVAEKINAPDALNKKRIRNGKAPIFDYHVLNVVVPGKKRGYSPETEPLSHNRVHLCRGHFKEYTSEHPLFGHLTGLYWWQPHVRGQNKSGIVVKDYNVKTA